MTLEAKTVLVTGGTGFVGGRLIEKLVVEERAHVRALVRNFGNAPRIARFPIELIGGDIADDKVVKKAVEGCDVIFHCAHAASLSRDKQMVMALQGTRNLGQAALETGVARMVHISTFAVYGPTLDGDLIETSPWQPSDHSYIRAKRAAEQLVLDLHRQQGLPVVVLQPTVVYGPFCKPWTLRPIVDLTTGLVPLVNGGEGFCNAVYIDDVIDAMILAASQPDVLGEVFLISAEQPVSWKTFYGAFEDVLGLRATVEISAEKLVAMAKKQARADSLGSQLLHLARQRNIALQAISLPPVRASLKILKNYIPEEQRRLLKSRLLPNGAKNRQDKQTEKPIHIPNETSLALYSSQTRVKIDKAQKLLNYQPRFDFRRGMDLTGQFIHWANLVPDSTASVFEDYA